MLVSSISKIDMIFSSNGASFTPAFQPMMKSFNSPEKTTIPFSSWVLWLIQKPRLCVVAGDQKLRLQVRRLRELYSATKELKSYPYLSLLTCIITSWTTSISPINSAAITILKECMSSTDFPYDIDYSISLSPTLTSVLIVRLKVPMLMTVNAAVIGIFVLRWPSTCFVIQYVYIHLAPVIDQLLHWSRKSTPACRFQPTNQCVWAKIPKTIAYHVYRAIGLIKQESNERLWINWIRTVWRVKQGEIGPPVLTMTVIYATCIYAIISDAGMSIY